MADEVESLHRLGYLHVLEEVLEFIGQVLSTQLDVLFGHELVGLGEQEVVVRVEGLDVVFDHFHVEVVTLEAVHQDEDPLVELFVVVADTDCVESRRERDGGVVGGVVDEFENDGHFVVVEVVLAVDVLHVVDEQVVVVFDLLPDFPGCPCI